MAQYILKLSFKTYMEKDNVETHKQLVIRHILCFPKDVMA